MIRDPPICRFGLKAFLILFILFPATVLGGSDAGKPRARIDQGRRIELSLRITEAKGNRIGRIYFRSLLRQSKRKPIRIELPGRNRTSSSRD